MKTLLEKRKKLLTILLLIACALVMGLTGMFCIKPKVSASAEAVHKQEKFDDTTILSELSDEECIEFIVSRGVNIPSDFINSPDLGKIVKSKIEIIEVDPSYEFHYNYDVTLNFANEIKNVVNEFYGIEHSTTDEAISTYATEYYLQDSRFYSNTGYMDYNCYAYAINRTENPAQYKNKKGYIPYQPGDVSGQEFNMTLSISQMAQVVKSDLIALGYSNITVSTEFSKDYTRRTICIRKGSQDYHFMRYNYTDKTDRKWYHKPGFTSILQYNYFPSNDREWTNECVTTSGTAIAPDLTYNSTIYYISYDYFGGGTGTPDDPFLIKTPDHFRNMEFVTKQFYETYQGYEHRMAHSYKLMADITIKGWRASKIKFAGDFDGNNHSITYDTTYSKDEEDLRYIGLFGFCSSGSSGAVIKNLFLKDCVVKVNIGTLIDDYKTKDVGILAGTFYNAAKIENVTVLNCTIECNSPNAYTGGIAGSLSGTDVINCVVRNGSFTTHSGYLGGMAGVGDLYRFQGGSCSTTLIKKNYSDGDKIGDVVGNSTETSTVTCSNNIKKEKPCVTRGSLITLADGRQVPVESLTGNEMLLVWDLTTGTFGSAPILFIDKDEETWYNVINLTFSDGTHVEIINEHGFWDVNLNRYIYLREDAASYIGHWFNKQDVDQNGNLITTTVLLTNVEITREYTVAYSPVTYGHLCYYVNGLLSMPGGIDGLFNIFEVDAGSMKYDTTAMESDIAQYGLFTYEEFSQIIPVPQDVFDAFNAQYFKVAIGKGLVTKERLVQLVDRYAEQLGI